MKLTGHAYDKCTGCSRLVSPCLCLLPTSCLNYAVFQIIDAYREQGFDMLLKAFEDATHLERITGLDKLADETDAALEAWDGDEDEEGDDF